MAVDSRTTRRLAAKAAAAQGKGGVKGLSIPRRFSKPGVHPFDEITWDRRTAAITNDKGEVIFEQKDVEIPASWSQLAANVVVSKYFRGALDTPDREISVRQLLERVSGTLAAWGRKDGYFASDADADAFYGEMTHLLLHQKVCFNSPVWFNMGIEEHPQCSACFINSVEDTLDSILDLAKTEGMLFKWGSGAGTNLSAIRSSKERLSSGGWASGPVSFMRGYDAFAGVIKSGGKTRRAAKMQILNIDHPDVFDFITSKMNEERKAWALIDAGYDGSVNGEAYGSVYFQNANLSIRVTDDFMKAAVEDREWHTRAVTDSGRIIGSYKARELLRTIAEGTHVCGDPGMQFDTTINAWHTCINSEPIRASNPCSEYMFLDNSACNLASLNLMRFRREDGEFDVEAFRHAVDLVILAQEIIVGNASYPTPKITKNSVDYRTLGLGYANLGALLMARGVPYDSDEGRDFAAAITSLMCGEAYRQSALVARDHGGPFTGYEKNREPFLRVMNQHRAAAQKIGATSLPADLLGAARGVWDDAIAVGSCHGFRNAQVTVLAPTGTIAFMMDCDTTGIEPDIALVKYKKLVGGGLLKIVNRTVPEALQRLGYTADQVSAIIDFLDEHETIEGAPHLKPEHLPVFDCAFKASHGTRAIHYMGHIRMMSAVQPFISGAISKTVNLPTEATVDEIMEAYLQSWKLGLKAVAIYRDGCKRSQPLNIKKKDGVKTDREPEAAAGRPTRRRLNDERQAITHKFDIAGHEGYITAGMYENGQPGEIFVTMAKEGSMTSGLMDALATMVSIALQYGVPLKVLCDKLSHTRFEPSGVTGNPEIPIAKSITDYLFRWLSLKFIDAETGQPRIKESAVSAVPATAPRASAPNGGNGGSGSGVRRSVQVVAAAAATDANPVVQQRFQIDAPPCPVCGSIMTANGACYKCDNCGATSGCS
jgi:ribonucleoside-diphosphate reductase alpha chain